MDMIKITKEMVPESNNVEISVGDDKFFIVKKNIPYSLKQIMAFQLYMYTMTTDDDKQIVYKSFKTQLAQLYLKIKYYTNIDVSQLDSEYGWPMLFDWITFNGLYQTFDSVIKNDYAIVERVYNDIFNSSKYEYEITHSIQHRLSKLFDSFVGDEDILQQLAKTSQINNTMISMIDAYNKQNKNTNNRTQNIVSPFGVPLNISKKK